MTFEIEIANHFKNQGKNVIPGSQLCCSCNDDDSNNTSDDEILDL